MSSIETLNNPAPPEAVPVPPARTVPGTSLPLPSYRGPAAHIHQLALPRGSGTHAIVLLSGGQDSTTALFWALERFEKVSALHIQYGQRHANERESASAIAKLRNVDIEFITAPADMLTSVSPLTNYDSPLPTYDSYEAMVAEVGDGVEKTFVPGRNALFLTIAANRAAAVGASDVVIGVSGQDSANYPDCTANFVGTMAKALGYALGLGEQGFKVHAPLMSLSKSQTVALSLFMAEGAAYEAMSLTHTAYDGQYPPTGKDHASLLRAKGFEEAGVPDPLVVRAWQEGLMKLPQTANYVAAFPGEFATAGDVVVDAQDFTEAAAKQPLPGEDATA